MKKIFVFIFLVIAASVSAQTFPLDMDTTLGAYIYERDNGNIPEAERLAYELIIKTGAYCNMITAIGQGDNASATAALNDLNTRLGTSYALPTFTFDETTQSYLSLDSIEIGGLGYQDSLITWTGVQYAISLYNILTASDTAWTQSEISDSSQAAITTANAYTDAAVSASVVGDSTWVSITTDTLNLSTTDAAVVKNESSGITFRSAGVTSFSVSGYGLVSGQANGVLMPNTSINDIRYVPNQADNNTGFTWESADKLGLQAGDLDVAYFYEVGNKEIAEIVDSFVVGGYSNFLDTVYINYAIDAEADEQWVGLSATGGLFADSISDAGYGLIDELLPIDQYFNDQKDGELGMIYLDKNSEPVVRYGLSKNLRKALQQMLWLEEHLVRYAVEQKNRADQLESKLLEVDKRLRKLEAVQRRKSFFRR